MFQVLKEYFEQHAVLTEHEFDIIKGQFVHKQLRKNEFLLREGEVAKYAAFVAKGCMRSYIIDKKGKEHIVQFAPETWWLADNNSVTSKTPTIYFMDAIEETELLLIDSPSHGFLLQQSPVYASFFQTGIQKHAAAKDKRIASSLSETAEEKYNGFLNTYPSLAQRLPQHMLAAYLGVTPETLSRVRKKRSQNK